MQILLDRMLCKNLNLLMKDVFQEAAYRQMRSYLQHQAGVELVAYGEFLIAKSEQNSKDTQTE